MPRRSRPWAWSAASPSAGMNSTAISSRPAGASDVGGGLGAASKVLRLLLQSAILAVGAWLVINQQSTPGIIIAGSILGARALAPVDLAIANWRGFVAARQSWQRLSKLLGHLPAWIISWSWPRAGSSNSVRKRKFLAGWSRQRPRRGPSRSPSREAELDCKADHGSLSRCGCNRGARENSRGPTALGAG